ncbi:MAG: sensor domain-containing phosphodiesterase [Candidatus Eremiobacteraeota bacterium]|nr:sensor domain-containing phosphodiesterase [Candidatus Eremiobacteraeota bacterium]
MVARGEDRLRGRLSALHRIVARAGVALEQSREELLAEALTALDLEFGSVMQVREGIAYPTTFLARRPDATPVRNPHPLDELIASVVVARGATFAAADLADDVTLRDHLQVRERGVRAYVGTPVQAGGGDAFVLTMGSTHPRATPFAGEDLAYVELLAALFAQSLRHEMQERSIERLSHHDRLTGFPLESRMLERLGAMVAAGEPFSLLALDIDIARILGEYDYGLSARVLAAVARRLETAVGPRMAAYRGHETDFFVVLDDGLDVGTLANDVRRVLALPFSLDGHEIVVSGAIGIAANPRASELAEVTVARAVQAVREARAGSWTTTRVATFDDDAGRLRARLLGELRGVAERDELVLHYQPVLRVSDGSVRGVEALLRWQHPHLGLLQPSAFIPLAEENESVVAIGMWVLRRAARLARRLADAGYAISVAVNVASAQIQDVAFIDRLRFATREAGVPPSALELEITETAALRDMAAATNVLSECRELGVRVALDDFGTAYASLAYLRDLPSDIVKIDRSFVGALPDDPRAAAIASATIVLARRLGRVVQAEGVETAEQLAWLVDEGCDLVQGYYLGVPMDEEKLLAHLAIPWNPLVRR